MSNKLITVLVVVVVLMGGFLLFKGKSVAPTEIVPGNQEVVEEVAVVPSVREFVVEAVPFSFSLSTMEVNKGDTVRITVKNVKGTHDFKLDEFNVSTRILNVGEEQVITFVADKVGTFEYYCSVSNHRAMGMVGTLNVL